MGHRGKASYGWSKWLKLAPGNWVPSATIIAKLACVQVHLLGRAPRGTTNWIRAWVLRFRFPVLHPHVMEALFAFLGPVVYILLHVWRLRRLCSICFPSRLLGSLGEQPIQRGPALSQDWQTIGESAMAVLRIAITNCLAERDEERVNATGASYLRIPKLSERAPPADGLVVICLLVRRS